MLDLLVPSAPGIYCRAIRSGACRYLPVVTTGHAHPQESSYLQFKLCRQISHLWSVVLTALDLCGLLLFALNTADLASAGVWVYAHMPEGPDCSQNGPLRITSPLTRENWSSTTWPKTLLNHSWQLPVWRFVCVLTAAETKPQCFQANCPDWHQTRNPLLVQLAGQQQNSARLKF